MAGRQVQPAPRAERGHHRDELHARFGEAVADLLAVGRVVRAPQQAVGDQAPQPVGEDVRGDALLGAGQQLAEVVPVAEHHVAQHHQ